MASKTLALILAVSLAGFTVACGDSAPETPEGESPEKTEETKTEEESKEEKKEEEKEEKE
ncbi:MAG: hypothetical protein QNJ54_32090 [Prochloraceae cyanobacterium]|nr:hypothetical protein [Prochloraceae cyanobacterium]